LDTRSRRPTRRNTNDARLPTEPRARAGERRRKPGIWVVLIERLVAEQRDGDVSAGGRRLASRSRHDVRGNTEQSALRPDRGAIGRCSGVAPEDWNLCRGDRTLVRNRRREPGARLRPACGRSIASGYRSAVQRTPEVVSDISYEEHCGRNL